ncbi:phospholipase D family protein [bacterium]|nr:phospholipase D family protein [bacterium]
MDSEIIPTHQIGARIIDLVLEATRRVVLVSPYLKIWGHLENALQTASRKSVELYVVFRRDKREEYRELVEQLHKVKARVFDLKDLHAKVYVNETSCILTSMNLYGSSAQNSEEFAILSRERSLVHAVNKYVDALMERGEKLRPKSKLASALTGTFKAAAGMVAAVAEKFDAPGTCIRCGTDIDYDSQKPLCPGCYKAWAKYKNPKFKEKRCHSCGVPAGTTMARPLCPACYKKEH